MLLCLVCCTHTDLTGVPSSLQNATPLRMGDRMSSVIPYLWLVVRNPPVTPPFVGPSSSPPFVAFWGARDPFLIGPLGTCP